MASVSAFGLICPLCQQLFNEPKTLHCLHSFCEHCLSNHTNTVAQTGEKHSAVDCPTCSKSSAVPDDVAPALWVQGLPTNRSLALAAAACEKNADLVLCALCQKISKSTPSTMFCLDCCKFQCDDCVTDHAKFGIESHRIIKPEELVNHGSNKVDLTQLEMCEEHSKPLEYYCKIHSVLCCQGCRHDNHTECKDIKDISAIEQTSVGINTDELKVEYLLLRNKLECSANFYEENQTSLESQSRLVKCHIDQIRKGLNEKINALEKRIMGQVSLLVEKRKEGFQEGQTKSKHLKAAVEGSVHILDEAVRRGSVSQAFIAKTKSQKQLLEYIQGSQEVFNNLKSLEFFLKLGEDTSSFLNDAMPLCTLDTKYSYHTIDSLLDYRRAKLDFAVERELKKGEDGNIVQPLLSGMTFLPDGRLVAIDNKNRKCLLMNERLEILRDYQLDCRVYDIAVDKNDQVMITSTKKLICLKIKPNNTITLVETIDTTCNTDSISARSHFESFVVGGFDEEKPVHVVLRSGMVENIELDLPTDRTHIDKSKCAYSNVNGQFTLTDCERDAVYVYNMDHKQRINVRHNDVKAPRGVAIDDTGCSFVCCQDAQSIVQVSPVGQVMEKFPLESMAFPRTICISSDNTRLAVSNADSQTRMLRVYKLYWHDN